MGCLAEKGADGGDSMGEPSCSCFTRSASARFIADGFFNAESIKVLLSWLMGDEAINAQAACTMTREEDVNTANEPVRLLKDPRHEMCTKTTKKF